MTLVTGAQLKVNQQRTEAGAVFVLTGEIDMATAGELRAAAAEALASAPDRITLDFAGVTFCDSQGLSTLIAINREATQSGSRLVLVHVGDFMSRLFDITGLRAAFEFE